jgi:hypothetical protein
MVLQVRHHGRQNLSPGSLKISTQAWFQFLSLTLNFHTLCMYSKDTFLAKVATKKIPILGTFFQSKNLSIEK